MWKSILRKKKDWNCMERKKRSLSKGIRTEK
jgi:hypothetical protein